MASSFSLSATEVGERLASIRERIGAACTRAGRSPDSVELVAVSKGQSPDAVKTAAELGLRLFGENKVQEGRTKIPLCPGHLRWHMIGHLQTNKVRDAVRCFEMIHSVDSLRLATEIDDAARKAAKRVAVLIEVNVAGESTKFGYKPDELLAELEALNALNRLELRGLMGMAPWSPEPERAKAVFSRLRELKTSCEERLGAPLEHLSMGMSGDFEVAIEEGATLVRIGTALFGARA